MRAEGRRAGVLGPSLSGLWCEACAKGGAPSGGRSVPETDASCAEEPCGWAAGLVRAALGSWAEPRGSGIVGYVHLSPSLHPRDGALFRRGEAEGSCSTWC